MKPIRYFLKVLRYLFSHEFLQLAKDPHFRLKFGIYTRHNGDRIPYFLESRAFPLTRAFISGRPILESIQAKRVLELMENSAFAKSQNGTLYGREASRVKRLIDARSRGEDSFVLLLNPSSDGALEIDDGATRACVLALTGGTSARAVVSPWV